MTWIARDREIVSRLAPARTPAVAAEVVGRKPREVERLWRTMGGSARPFTEDERDYIRARWCCIPVARIGAQLGRSPEEIVAEAETMGLTADHVPLRPVTNSDRTSWRAARLAGMSFDEIARLTGRAKSVIRQNVRGLADMGLRGRSWSHTDDAIVKANWGKLSSVEIGKKVGRSGAAVRARAQKLGLVERQ